MEFLQCSTCYKSLLCNLIGGESYCSNCTPSITVDLIIIMADAIENGYNKEQLEAILSEAQEFVKARKAIREIAKYNKPTQNQP